MKKAAEVPKKAQKSQAMKAANQVRERERDEAKEEAGILQDQNDTGFDDDDDNELQVPPAATTTVPPAVTVTVPVQGTV